MESSTTHSFMDCPISCLQVCCKDKTQMSFLVTTYFVIVSFIFKFMWNHICNVKAYSSLRCPQGSLSHLPFILKKGEKTTHSVISLKYFHLRGKFIPEGTSLTSREGLTSTEVNGGCMLSCMHVKGGNYPCVIWWLRIYPNTLARWKQTDTIFFLMFL